MFKSAADRLRALLKSLRPHLSAVLPPPGDRISEPRHPLVHAIGASSDPIADVRLQDAVPLNAGTCVFRANLEVATDPNSGGYSALVPVLLSDRYSGPVSFRCLLDVRDGAVGISAVTSDCRIIAERAATRTGAQQLEIFVAGSHDVAGILIRNFAVTGRRSRAIIESVSASAWQAENFLRIQRTSRNRILHLPLRKQLDEPTRETTKSISTILDLDIGTCAAIIVDAWKELGGRVAANISEELAPTLNALRSTGMAIIHAAHDHEIHPLARPLVSETEIPGDFHDIDFIANMLRDAGIQTLIYLGYFSNMCVIQRSIGMLEMKRRGFNTILVRDASAAKETDATAADEWCHKGAIQLIEVNGGMTVTAAELQAAIAESANAVAPTRDFAF